MIIYCLFSVVNEYDQPDANLEAWWAEKPSFETLLKIIRGSSDNPDSIIAASKIYEGKSARYMHYSYLMQECPEGKVEVDW